jgi:succinoglycan biosynthesis transport protein ExoP
MDVFQLPGILWRRWLYVLVPMLMVVALAGAYVAVVKPTIPVEADILIDTQGLVAEKTDLVPQIAAQSQDSSILESQIYVMQSSEILSDVVDKLDLTRDPFLYKGPLTNKDAARSAAVAALQKHLSIERAGQSFILNLTLKHRDAVQGAAIANTIAAVYLKKVHEARNDASNRASGAFELQAQTLASRVRKAEQELEKFKAAHDLVSTGQQGLVIDQQVAGVNTQLLAARADLGVKRSSYEQARSLTVGSVQDGAIPEALASTALGTMRARYADMAASANELATSLGANHPQMRAARSQLDGMRQSIEQELNRIRQSLKSGLERSEGNVKALEDRLDSLTRSSLDTSEAGIKARELQSEVDTLRALYKAFLSRSEELGQRDTVNINNSRIISKAVAVTSSSKIAQVMILIAASLFGFALGCGVAILREMAGRLFVRPAQAEAANEIVADEEADIDEPVEVRQRMAVPDAGARVADEPLATPVIAHMPLARKPPSVRFANARSRVDAARMNLTGVSMTIDRILSLPRAATPSTIVLVSPGNDNPGRHLSRELADALYRQHKDVFFSTGEGAEGEDPAAAADLPLGDVLRFRRLSPVAAPPGDDRAPTFRNFASRRRQADYVIIDGRGHEARRYLDELLAQADGILVLASHGDAPQSVDGLMQTLAPFKDRMLGTILFDRAA